MSQPTQPTSSPATSAPAQGAAVPIWLIVLTVMLLYVGALYFDDHGGWFHPQVYAPYRSSAELEIYKPKSDGSLFPQGRAVYAKTCVACHQASGLGTPGQFPPLAGSEWVNEAEPGRMIRAVLNGILPEPIIVKGQTFSGAMVPWNSLTDEDIAAVITYVRQNKEWGNNASAVTPERVKAVREKIKSHPASFKPDELLKVSPAD